MSCKALWVLDYYYYGLFGTKQHIYFSLTDLEELIFFKPRFDLLCRRMIRLVAQTEEK